MSIGNRTADKPAGAAVLNSDQCNDRLTDIEGKVDRLRESVGGVGAVVEEPSDFAGHLMGERIERLENNVTELIAMLSITGQERNTKSKS